MNITGLNIIFLSPVSLSGRKDVTSDNVNFRPDIKQNFLEKKKKKKKKKIKKIIVCVAIKKIRTLRVCVALKTIWNYYP